MNDRTPAHLLRIVMDNMNEGMVVYDSNDVIIAHNQQFMKLWGIPEQSSWVGRQWPY